MELFLPLSVILFLLQTRFIRRWVYGSCVFSRDSAARNLAHILLASLWPKMHKVYNYGRSENSVLEEHRRCWIDCSFFKPDFDHDPSVGRLWAIFWSQTRLSYVLEGIFLPFVFFYLLFSFLFLLFRCRCLGSTNCRDLQIAVQLQGANGANRRRYRIVHERF